MIQIDPTTQVYFSPQDDTVTEFETLLKSATKSIHLADYSFNIPEVVTILIDQMKAGLEVKLVLDKSQSAGKTEVPEITSLKQAGVDTAIGTSSDHKIMHSKFTIIDGITVEAGSWNYTAVAADEDNFFFVIENPTIVEAFESDFENMRSWILANEAQS